MKLSIQRMKLVIFLVHEAIQRTRAEIDAALREEITDLEDYMLQLDKFEGELRAEYERLRSTDKDLPSYDVLTGERRFRKL